MVGVVFDERTMTMDKIKPTVKVCEKCQHYELLLTNALHFCGLRSDERDPDIGVDLNAEIDACFFVHPDFGVPNNCPFILEHIVNQKKNGKR